MYKNRIYRQIAADCTKAYWSSILFYALQLIVSQVAVAYSARMLGVFSAYILNNEIQKGLGCLWQILICVAISVTLPLACSPMGELLMFRASLNHERAVLNRYLNKTYAAAVGLRGSDAQFRLEEDQTQLGIYWNTTGMYLVSVPIVVIYLLWQMVPVMGWFTLFVAAVCCVRIFVPVFFRKKTEEYDRLERESRTKMRNLEQEMLEKPVELCLYGLQSDELARLKCLQKDYLETLFVKKAKLETWQKNILGGMDSFCMLVLLAASAIAISSGKMGAEDILLPEKYDYDEQQLINNIINNRKKGKTHHLIINAEGIGHSTSMAKRIEAATGVETRATILGYMQRGGSPTCLDRYYASIMGAYAADILCAGSSNRVVAYKHGEFVDYDIEEALAMQKEIPEYHYQVSKALAT